jgi:hypothetical protein
LHVNGQVVHSERFSVSATKLRRELDLSGLAKGVYMLQLTSDNGRAMRRAVIR